MAPKSPRSSSPARSSEDKGSSKQHKKEQPPSAIVIALTYLVLGALLLYFSRRKSFLPGRRELLAPALVSALWVWQYSILDVMGVGIARIKSSAKLGETYRMCSAKLPEEAWLANRVQANQVEQMSVFFVAMWTFSVFVNGYVGAGLGALWVALRVAYAHVYRRPGASVTAKGLARFTLPCYFIVNAMAGAVVCSAVEEFLLL